MGIYSCDWRAKLRIPGICATDAGSLYDHLNKTGSIPEERQILMTSLSKRSSTKSSISVSRKMMKASSNKSSSGVKIQVKKNNKIHLIIYINNQ